MANGAFAWGLFAPREGIVCTKPFVVGDFLWNFVLNLRIPAEKTQFELYHPQRMKSIKSKRIKRLYQIQNKENGVGYIAPSIT